MFRKRVRNYMDQTGRLAPGQRTRDNKKSPIGKPGSTTYSIVE